MLSALLRKFHRPVYSPLWAYRHNYCSQNGEDGVLDELMRRLMLGPAGWAVEFGAWDGKHLSNTYRILTQHPGFNAVMIEADPARYHDLLLTASALPGRVVAVNALVTPSGPSSLDSLLAQTPIPADFEVLSIDVDGDDYHLWKSLSSFRPKIVVIEVNSSFHPGQDYIHGPAGVSGSSFRSMVRLGRAKGYVCVCHTGNLIFVRDDLVRYAGVSALVRRLPELLYDWRWQGT